MNLDRMALCVGIKIFKNYPDQSLKGCVNDANNMEIILKKYFGFDNSNIVKIIDKQATKENIMNNLKEMVTGAREGKFKYLVFTLSTHGTQVPDLSGDEPDRADEAFCPYDLAETGNMWDPNYIITDDELHELFITLPADVLLEVFLDTCHSGTGIKAVDLLLTRKPKYIPPPSLEAFEKVDGCLTRGLYKSFLEKNITYHILWAACQANQPAADAQIDDSWHGAFTYYLCKEIDANQNKITRSELLNKIREDLKANRFTQMPQLDCEATNRNKIIS